MWTGWREKTETMKIKPIYFALLCGGLSFFRDSPSTEPVKKADCAGVSNFKGYTFLLPDIVNVSGAYAPFFLEWDDYYKQNYFGKDVQREENIKEWNARFCDRAEAEDVEYVVYKADMSELNALYLAAADKTRKSTLPYRLGGNTFAQVLAYNGCIEAISYLMFARKCEPFAMPTGDGWSPPARDTAQMYAIVREGMRRFKNTDSHFIKMRYAYQMIRMAHYAEDWQYTIHLYEFLMPKVDRKRYSILFHWTLGHYAGALQRMGRYPEAAYRFSLVFRNCSSKRQQAFRSFLIRNDEDWQKALKLCQSDAEKSTLHIMRSGGTHQYAVEDMDTVHELDPKNPQLDLLLVSDVQRLEKIFLRTTVTDRKQNQSNATAKRRAAATHLLDLQVFVRKALAQKEIPNIKLWRALEGYLELLAGDRYGAKTTWDRLEKSFGKDKDDSEWEAKLRKQIATWRILIDIFNLDLDADKADEMAFKVRSLDGFRENPNFEAFLQDWLGNAYASHNRPGSAIIAAYPPSAVGLNPDLAAIDDLLRLAGQNDPVLLEYAMQMDTNPDRIKAYFLEMKGMYLMGQGEMESAFAVLRGITPVEEARMVKFAPFREVFDEKVHRVLSDSLLLNRKQVARKILDYEFRAKAAAGLGEPAEAWYYYLIGLAYYNMSYFGYEWRAMDNYRSGHNQLRLPSGPVFPLAGSPAGNREYTDVSKALSYFQKALEAAQTPELAAQAAFLAARCQQKRYFTSKDCAYRPGSRLIPTLPEGYNGYYDLLERKYAKTKFYAQMVKECKWFAAYTRK
jgi:hypothetical protein